MLFVCFTAFITVCFTRVTLEQIHDDDGDDDDDDDEMIEAFSMVVVMRLVT